MLSRLEKETIIIFNEEDEVATVSTLSKKVANRFKKAGYSHTMLDTDSYLFEIPKRNIKILEDNNKRKSFYPSGKNQ
ncbi:hypothetical protein ACVBAX_06250 [Robertmurraya sp. GLU-23]